MAGKNEGSSPAQGGRGGIYIWICTLSSYPDLKLSVALSAPELYLELPDRRVLGGIVAYTRTVRIALAYTAPLHPTLIAPIKNVLHFSFMLGNGVWAGLR